MMAKKLQMSGLSQMVAKKAGGNPVTPAMSPTTTLPAKQTVATTAVKIKKVAKVKRVVKPAKKPNALVKKRTVKK